MTNVGNSGHDNTNVGASFLGSLGNTDENAIVLNESTAGDSHFNPIEIPHDPNTHRKRKHGSDGGDDRYKLQCRMESRQSSQSPFVPWVEATLYL